MALLGSPFFSYQKCLPIDLTAVRRPSNSISITRATAGSSISESLKKTCLRCGKQFRDEDNGPSACAYHGHMTGERGLFAMAPPHQGIDGDWTDESGVIVYKWNDEDNRPNTGRKNWKSRWTCCGVYDKDAPPCRRGRHVSYDDGATLF